MRLQGCHRIESSDAGPALLEGSATPRRHSEPGAVSLASEGLRQPFFRAPRSNRLVLVRAARLNQFLGFADCGYAWLQPLMFMTFLSSMDRRATTGGAPRKRGRQRTVLGCCSMPPTRSQSPSKRPRAACRVLLSVQEFQRLKGSWSESEKSLLMTQGRAKRA